MGRIAELATAKDTEARSSWSSFCSDGDVIHTSELKLAIR